MISGVSQELLNETFSSRSSATPGGTTYAFDATLLSAAALARNSSAISSVQSSPTSQSLPSSLSSPVESTNSGEDPDTLLGGTIAGIVVGCVVGVAAIVVAGHVIIRRHRRGKNATNHMNNVSEQLLEKKEPDNMTGLPFELPENRVPVEIGGGYEAFELSDRQKPSELPAHGRVN
ncbi:hypothetical protein Q7P35_004872 [Cladosporium inversicolor]